MDFSTVPERKEGKGEKKLLPAAGPAPLTAHTHVPDRELHTPGVHSSLTCLGNCLTSRILVHITCKA